MTASFARLLLAMVLSAGLIAGLAACGKKGHVKPPDGQASEYTYPNAYPAPETVVPDARSEAGSGGGGDPFWLFNGDKRTKTKSY